MLLSSFSSSLKTRHGAFHAPVWWECMLLHHRGEALQLLRDADGQTAEANIYSHLRGRSDTTVWMRSGCEPLNVAQFYSPAPHTA